ncbi:unnamed protein product [Heterotrigona itama]|uniref:Spaetzle domain-containing protein n=1 Tax=Heterotrigona itama TaxID=395501 RepID=A0A6V7HBI3_9HYME|nr:unnamed protein product [Heterotrigona itama]
MTFNSKDIGQGYNSLALMHKDTIVIGLCFLITLMTQHICAHPQRDYSSERSAERITSLENVNRLNIPIDHKVTNTRRRGMLANPPARNWQLNDKIIFPDEGSVSRRVPVCKGSTYCETVDSYPEDVVNRALQKNDSIRYLAGIDVVSMQYFFQRLKKVSSSLTDFAHFQVDIGERIETSDDTIPLCVSTEQVIYPQSGENKNKEWKFIANQENFKQGVRVEKCRTNGASCSVIGEIAAGYKTVCKQKYIYRELASVLEDGSIVPDSFRFPSSCCCHAFFTGNPFTRMGLGIPFTSTKRPTEKK